MSRKKLSKVRRADPFFERESTRYDFPLPSREYVSQVLADEGRPLEFTELTMMIMVSEWQHFVSVIHPRYLWGYARK